MKLEERIKFNEDTFYTQMVTEGNYSEMVFIDGNTARFINSDEELVRSINESKELFVLYGLVYTRQPKMDDLWTIMSGRKPRGVSIMDMFHNSLNESKEENNMKNKLTESGAKAVGLIRPILRKLNLSGEDFIVVPDKESRHTIDFSDYGHELYYDDANGNDVFIYLWDNALQVIQGYKTLLDEVQVFNNEQEAIKFAAYILSISERDVLRNLKENKNKEKNMSKETIDKIKSLKEKSIKTKQTPEKKEFIKSEAISRATFKTYFKQIAEKKGKKPETKDLKEGFVQSPTNHYKKSNKLDTLLFPGEAKDIMKKVEELMSQNKNADAIKPMLHRAKSSLTEILDTAYKVKDYTSTKVTEAIEFIKQVDSMLDSKKPITEKKVEVKEEPKKVIAENKETPMVPKSQKLQDLDAKLEQIVPKKITLDDVR